MILYNINCNLFWKMKYQKVKRFSIRFYWSYSKVKQNLETVPAADSQLKLLGSLEYCRDHLSWSFVQRTLDGLPMDLLAFNAAKNRIPRTYGSYGCASVIVIFYHNGYFMHGNIRYFTLFLHLLVLEFLQELFYFPFQALLGFPLYELHECPTYLWLIERDV